MEQVFRNPLPEIWPELIKRPKLEAATLNEVVGSVLSEVREKGDEALKAYSLKFDGVDLTEIAVSEDEIREAIEKCPGEIKDAIEVAVKTITEFHSAQFDEEKHLETAEGVECWRKSLPIETVGLYIPGGRAPLFSTVLMLALPAKVAGCKKIILCSPPDKEGKINPAILYAAQRAGVTDIFKVGGAQAVAAMAYGTQSVPKVDKIFGPGNQYVTAAKSLVQREVAIDMPAGPTEVLVIADETSRAEFVAADLLSQAEHGPDSQVILLTDSEKVISDVEAEIKRQITEAPRREIMEAALKHSRIILFNSLETAVKFANFYAPEHLVLAVSDPYALADKVTSAGSVFLGHFAAESFGDYVSGVNHTLPTAGFARAYSGVSLDSFIKKITFQILNENGVQSIGKAAEIMAKAEGLYAHANAVTVRLKATQPQKRSFSLRTLLRPNILKLKPYVCARHEFSGKGIMLDANENSLGSVCEETLNRYPDPYQREVKAAVSQIKGVPQENILLGNGSDEVIDLLFRAFCEPRRDEIIIMPPTYGMYEVSAEINDVRVKAVKLDDDFQIRKDEVLKAVTPQTKLIFICSPNNPSGNALKRDDITDIIENFRGIVVVDEAYNDFAEANSLTDVLREYPNLVILQTFSKAWGMAGARLGMLFASEDIINVLNTIKPPYNINQLTLNTAKEALQNISRKNEYRNVLLSERKRLEQTLSRHSSVEKVYPSDANFLLVKFKNAQKTFEYLKEKGIIVRDRSKAAGCENCLRITVGTPQENEILLKALSEE